MSFANAWYVGYFAETYKDIHTVGTNAWICAALACAVIAYLFGSINCGLLISKLYGKDIRDYGSGNAGATNMTRTFGKKAGALTLLGDFLKTALALFACRMIFGTEGVFIGGIFCILGHAFPVFFKFKGGKGVVCTAATILFADPLVFVIMLAIFLVILFGFKMVSFASIMSVMIYPYMLYLVHRVYGIHIIYAAICAILVIFLHRKNLVRIFNHTESKFTFGKKKKEEDDEEC